MFCKISAYIFCINCQVAIKLYKTGHNNLATWLKISCHILQFMGISWRDLPSCLASEYCKCISIKHKLYDGLDKLTTIVIGCPCMNNMELLSCLGVKMWWLTIATWPHIASAGHMWLFYLVTCVRKCLCLKEQRP